MASWFFVLSVVVASAPAQEWVWRLPALGAAEYRREWRATASDACKTAGLARAAALVGKVPDRYLHRLAPAPWVCQGELTADQKALEGPVRDLRDVARAVACDLGSRGAIKGRFPRVLPFGDLALAGSWTTAAPDGTQTLRASVAGKPPATAPGDAKGVVDRLRPFCIDDVDGSLVMRRRVDAAAGRIVGYEAEFDLVVAEGPKAHRRLVVVDRWDLVAVRDNQDADFRKRVAAAIRAGTDFVREAIDEKKSFLVDAGKDERNYGSGRLALGLLTLVHGHVALDDPVLVRGFDDLRRRRLEDSYSLATALMAVAARRQYGGGRAPDERDGKAAKGWLQQLLANVDPRVQPAELLRFNYTAGPRYDTSLQQYGLLGLWSAQCLGLELPATAFPAAARHLLAVQGPPRGRTTLRLATYDQLREVAGTDERPRVPELSAQPRGFAYQEADEPPFGSMTSAGISALVLAQKGMAVAGITDRALTAAIDDAVRDAFAWLAEEFSVRANPGFAERADHHWYYWLYGLERSCELRSIALLQGRDWYHEGALQLLSQQQANGSFRAEHSSSLLLDTTCFAVLFLAKATPAAAITGR